MFYVFFSYLRVNVFSIYGASKMSLSQQASNDDVDKRGARDDHVTERWRHRRHVAQLRIAIAHRGRIARELGHLTAEIRVRRPADVAVARYQRFAWTRTTTDIILNIL